MYLRYALIQKAALRDTFRIQAICILASSRPPLKAAQSGKDAASAATAPGIRKTILYLEVSLAMNIKRLITTITILSATGSVFAQQTEWVNPAAQFVSSKTLADVRAEVKRAHADGSLATNDAFPAQVRLSVAPRTFTEVRAESLLSEKNYRADINGLYFGS
jgi:hypothetical protein